jgi:hypothetical protein
MTDPTLGVIIAAATLIVLVAGYVGTGHLRRSRRRSRIAIGPAPGDLRDRLVELRTLFHDIAADGGKDTRWFQDPRRKQVGAQLRDQANRVGDDQLKRHALDAVHSWDDAYGHAPAAPRPSDYFQESSNPAVQAAAVEQAQRLSVVADAADRGAERCDLALARLNELEQAIPEP